MDFVKNCFFNVELPKPPVQIYIGYWLILMF